LKKIDILPFHVVILTTKLKPKAMKKNLLKITALSICALLLLFSYGFSQDEKVEKLERPDKCGVAEIDNFVNKSCDSYEESLKSTKAVNFITVEGEGDEKVIKNADGEPVSKSEALLQLGELLVRAKKQNDNIQALQDLQKPATESLKKCPVQKKPKATKNLNNGGEALTEVIKETKKQIELIDKQIEEVKGAKE